MSDAGSDDRQHQHFILVLVLTVIGNVMLGDYVKNADMLDRRKVRDIIAKFSKDYPLKINSHVLVEDLSVGIQQCVAILKELARGT